MVVEDVTCRPGSFHHCVVWSLVVSYGLVVVENPGDCGVVSMSCVASPFLWSVVGVLWVRRRNERERCNDSRASRVLVVLLLSRCVCCVFGFLVLTLTAIRIRNEQFFVSCRVGIGNDSSSRRLGGRRSRFRSGGGIW